MDVREAALILAKQVAWDHAYQEESDNPNCEICQALRCIKQNPPIQMVTDVRVHRTRLE